MGEWRVRVCSNHDSIFWKQLEKTLGGIYIIRADNTAKDWFVSGSWLSQIRKLLDSSLTLIAREMFWEASEGLVVVNGATETSLETQESDLPSLNSKGSVGPVFIYRVRIITWLLQDNYGRSPTRGGSCRLSWLANPLNMVDFTIRRLPKQSYTLHIFSAHWRGRGREPNTQILNRE